MSFRKSVLTAVLLSCAIAGTTSAQEIKKTAGPARIEQSQGEERLVLHTGQTRTNVAHQRFYPDNIELVLDAQTWRKLEDQLLGPFGRAITLKDKYGNDVRIARANVYNKNGLMFYMGTRNVSITAEDFFLLKSARKK